jgi:hypothetical protein
MKHIYTYRIITNDVEVKVKKSLPREPTVGPKKTDRQIECPLLYAHEFRTLFATFEGGVEWRALNSLHRMRRHVSTSRRAETGA